MVIRMRHTRAHTKNRRSHHALSASAVVLDKSTNVPSLRHRVSPIDGKYKGKQVLNVTKKADKKLAKTKAKSK